MTYEPQHNMPAPRLDSESVIVSAPMSFAGSAQRLWQLIPRRDGWVKYTAATGIVLLILLVWALVICWYAVFGLFVIPYRLIRRGQRKNRKQELRHREMLTMMNQIGQPRERPFNGGNDDSC